VRFQETLRRLAMIDEGFVQDEAGLGLGVAGIPALDPKTAALLQVGASVAIGSPAVCLEWSAGRALAAGASEDEIAGVLLAVAPVAGLARVVAAAPEVATALGYDIEAALEEPDDHRRPWSGPPGDGAVAKEAAIVTGDQPGDGWTVVLRRQPARIVGGHAEGPYSDAFEVICCECGDDPGLEYAEVSRTLQLIRGPYPIVGGIAAYETHLSVHHQTGAAHR
jgi:alkylhydroperoxidase/carboxymuconolactone decarboxylase family protein YurZ